MAILKKDISSRGVKRTPEEIRQIANQLHWDKIEKSHDFSVESQATGLVGGPNATPSSRGAKNQGKVDKLNNIAKGVQTHSSGVLGGAHMGGHSDVSTAINLGGFTVKTPIVKPSSTKNK